MATTYRIYGNPDTRPVKGFPKPSDFRAYIGGQIFTENESRYRYTQTYLADVIVLSRKGKAYGHFEIDHAEDPTKEDLDDYETTKKVFIVKKSTLYENPITLNDLGYKVIQRGLPIEDGDFNLIIAAAGTLKTFTSDSPYDRRYCRLCYNLNGWNRPSGAAEESGTYFSENGFGHEEWLFRYEWCLAGQKYGFLQPFTKHLAKYQGSTFSLKLTTNYRGHTFFAGTIRRVYVPHDEELAEAYRQFVANGWLDQMKEEVAAVGGNVAALGANDPNLVLNVRFNPSDVVFHKDMPTFSDGSKPTLAPYYNLYEDDDGAPPTVEQSLTPKKREELQFLRAAQQGTIVDPKHAKLQNRLYDWLCQQHGALGVGFEVDFVDLRVTLPGHVTFYEIKTDSSAQRCIRSALGQLFEYAVYPAEAKADHWVVVGDPVPTPDDIAYLAHLRKEFGLPIYYARFDWPTSSLCPAV